jgi:hypothetical protein
MLRGVNRPFGRFKAESVRLRSVITSLSMLIGLRSYIQAATNTLRVERVYGTGSVSDLSFYQEAFRSSPESLTLPVL